MDRAAYTIPLAVDALNSGYYGFDFPRSTFAIGSFLENYLDEVTLMKGSMTRRSKPTIATSSTLGAYLGYLLVTCGVSYNWY